MRTSLLAVLSVTLILSGCGAGTGLNPFKSSAQPRPEAVQTTVAAAPQRTGQGLSKDPGLVQGSTLTPYSLLGKPQTTAPQGEAAPQARQGSRLNPLNWFGRRRTAEAVQPAQIVADGTAPTQTQATPRAGSGLVRAGAGKTKDPSPFKPVAAAAPAQISAQTSAQTDTIANPVVTQNPGGWRYSRLNPRNWFGRSRQTEVVAAAPVAGAPPRSNDPRPLVADVVNMAVEPMQGGAIVRATGLPQTQGWWNGALVALPVDDAGTLVFEFRLSAPVTQTAVSTPQSREVTVATFLSDFDLQGVSQIIVQGAQNARSSRR